MHKNILNLYLDTNFVKDHSDVHKNILNLMSLKCGISHRQFFVDLAERFFKKQLAFPWALTALPDLATYIFTGMRRSLYKVSKRG